MTIVYQQASYKGVPFEVQTMNSSGGHRLDVIDFPESDQHELEDMGNENDSFSITGYVIGDDYFQKREDLIAALKNSAPGELVYPTRGRFRVKNKSWSCVENKDEQRIARFTMSFEKKEDIVILTTADTQQTVYTKKAIVLEQTTEWFENAYDLRQKPITAINKATETIDKGLDVIRDAKQVTGSVSDFQRAVRELKGRKIALTLNARVMAEDIGSLVNYGTDPVNISPIPLDSFSKEQRQDSKNIQISMGVPLVNNARQPSQLIQQMIEINALVAESGLIASSEFDTPEEAIEEEKDIIKKFDDLINTIDPSLDLFNAIRDFLAAIHEDLEVRIINAPRTAVVKLEAQRNALEYLSSTYKDLEELDDFTKRNKIVNPAFVDAEKNINIKVKE